MAGAEIVDVQGAVVRITERADGRFKVAWRIAGKQRSTTAMTLEAARTVAKRKAKDLSASQGGAVVTNEERELVEKLHKVAGSRSAFSVLAQLEDFVKRLGGWDHLQRAIHFYEQSGMAKVERRTFTMAKHDFMERYLKRSRWTRAGLRKELDAFDRAHPGFIVCDLEELQLQRWLDRGDPAPRYFNNRLSTWRTFLNRCRQWNVWPKGEKHPGEMIGKVTEADRIPPIWTVEQAQAIVDALPERRLPYVVIGCWMGLRPLSELLNIHWDQHFDWERRYLHVTPEAAEKTSDERFVPIPENAWEMLRPWHQAKGRCCQTHDREEISKLLREKGLIKAWPQDVMRHSSISYAIAAGKTIGKVAEEHANSEGIIRKRYRRALRREDGEAWYRVRLTSVRPVDA